MSLLTNPTPRPQVFKGIALFTPGGDLVYCLDSQKQRHWHAHLCATLQELLNLSAPPHFLIPGYSATVDHWLDPISGQVRLSAELYPAVHRYQPLLNVIFDLSDTIWQMAPWQEEACNPILIESYRQQFPQLWENHELLVRLDRYQSETVAQQRLMLPNSAIDSETHQGYLLRLFVSGNSAATRQTLKTIHHLLEQHLQHPYTLKVIDISKHPEEAETHQVSATPTLVRVWPQPVRRIVGELEDVSRVLQIIATI